MARLTKEQQSRKTTVESLNLRIRLNGNEDKFLLDQIDQYMIYYDDLNILNNKINNVKDSPNDTKSYTELLKEKRQITKEMRGILTFLGLLPSSEEGGMNAGNEEGEDL